VSGIDGIIETPDYRGKLVLTAYGPLDIRTIRWGVFAKQDLDEIGAPIRDLRRLILLASLGLIALFAGLGVLYARRITRPLTAVHDVMTKLSTGKRAVTIPFLDRSDEIGRMTNALQVFHQALIRNDQMNETIRGAEARLMTILNQSPVGVLVQNREGIVRFANEPVAELLGSTRKKVIGANISEFSRASNPQDWTRFIEQVRQPGGVRGMEIDFEMLATRLTLTFSVTAERVTFADEPCLLMWAEDITERKRKERELERQRQLLKAVFLHMSQGLFAASADHVIVEANPRFQEILRLPPELARPGTPLLAMLRHLAERGEFGPGDPDRQAKERLALLYGHKTHRFERRTADGRIIDVESNQIPGGGYVTVYTDITARKQAEEELQRQAATLAASETQLRSRKQELEIEIGKSQALLEGAPDATVIVDKDAVIQLVNRAAEKLFGYPRHELIGQPVEILIPSRFRPQHPKLRNAYIANPAPRDMGAARELAAVARDGREFPVEISLSPIEGAGLVASSIRDISLRKAAEDELRRAKAAAEEATRAKSSFLAMMSHEIRTPMNGVMSMAEVLNQTDLDEDQRSMTRVILDSADALRTVINDILDFSKIEAGRLEVESVELDLGDLVESVGDLLAPRAEEKWLALHVDLDPAMPRRLRGDPSRIRQVLLNVCGNALKFTEEGSVQIRVSGRRDDARYVGRFEVTDTGIGLTPEQASRLFQPFVQAEASTSRRFGGTGLGLTISRRLCELMGGEIGVSSEKGKGSSFWFELPLAVVDARPYTSEVDLSGAKVVLVDYGRNEGRILQRYLKHVGLKHIFFAPPPGETIPLAQALQRIDIPMDLVIVNAREGASRAKAVLEELKRHGATRGARDVVAAPHLAASILRADAKSLADMQWLATLTTPIRMRRLWQVVGAAIGKVDLARVAAEQQERQAEYQAPEIDAAAAARAVILVAEDNATNRTVIKRVLGRLGFAHELAVNGAEALRMWEAGRSRYGLLLSDFHMPEMDGFELTRAIREREAAGGLPRLPIVALTADVLPQTEKDCLDAGMDGYLRKPIELPALHRALERWLPQAMALRREVRAAVSAAPSPAPVEAAVPTTPPVDHAVITQQIGTDDRGEHAACLRDFLESCEQGPGDLQAAIAAKDPKTVREVAHALKGASAMIGASKLAEVLKTVETAGRNADLQAAAGQMPAVQQLFAEVHRYIQSLTEQQQASVK
jgi:PAS domain S-box-containing protein